MSFEEQIDWVSKNPNHPLIKELAEASRDTQGDLKNGIQLALGIVVGYLSGKEKEPGSRPEPRP